MTQRSGRLARWRRFQARSAVVFCLVLAALSRCGAASAAGVSQQLPIPATFEISLHGRSAERDLPERSGLLQLLPFDGKDETGKIPFYIALAVGTGGEEGSLNWASPMPSGRHELTVTVESASVILEDGEAPVAPFWIADVGDPLFPGITQPFFVRKGSLSFRLRGDEISGKIRATGSSAYDNPQQEQTYEATFTGHRVLDHPEPVGRKP